VTPLEKERIDKGMSLYEGQWITAEEQEHIKKGEFKVSHDTATLDLQGKKLTLPKKAQVTGRKIAVQ